MQTDDVIRSVLDCSIGIIINENEGPFIFGTTIDDILIKITRDDGEFTFNVNGGSDLFQYINTTTEDIDVKYPALIQILGTKYLFLVKSFDESSRWFNQVVDILIYNPLTNTVFSYDFPSDYGVTSSTLDRSTPFD